MGVGLGGLAEAYDEQARGGEAFGSVQKQGLVRLGLELSRREDIASSLADGLVGSEKGHFGLRVLFLAGGVVGSENGEEFGLSGGGGGEEEFGFHEPLLS